MRVFNKVESVIKSCETTNQLDVAENMIDAYLKQTNDYAGSCILICAINRRSIEILKKKWSMKQ